MSKHAFFALCITLISAHSHLAAMNLTDNPIIRYACYNKPAQLAKQMRNDLYAAILRNDNREIKRLCKINELYRKKSQEQSTEALTYSYETSQKNNEQESHPDIMKLYDEAWKKDLQEKCKEADARQLRKAREVARENELTLLQKKNNVSISGSIISIH